MRKFIIFLFCATFICKAKAGDPVAYLQIVLKTSLELATTSDSTTEKAVEECLRQFIEVEDWENSLNNLPNGVLAIFTAETVDKIQDLVFLIKFQTIQQIKNSHSNKLALLVEGDTLLAELQKEKLNDKIAEQFYHIFKNNAADERYTKINDVKYEQVIFKSLTTKPYIPHGGSATNKVADKRIEAGIIFFKAK